MSNTGLKGITRVENESFVGYKITVGWCGNVVQRYVSGTGERALLAAFERRTWLEYLLGKPHTEQIVRSSGVDPHGRRWDRC
jgi:hypothetical protein